MTQELNILRKKIDISKAIECTDIKNVLNWYKSRINLDKTIVKKVPISRLKDWSILKNGNIVHKSNQFFSI